MERGLLWLPLLAAFIWLAGAGWNEYKKVEAYQSWAVNFERHKYDIYAVLGQKGDLLTWGIPTRSQPRDLQTISLSAVREIKLEVDGKLYQNWEAVTDLKSSNKIAIALKSDPGKSDLGESDLSKSDLGKSDLGDSDFSKPDLGEQVFKIRFTDLAIAGNWFRYLSSQIPNFQIPSS
jgi:hypothetical protein